MYDDIFEDLVGEEDGLRHILNFDDPESIAARQSTSNVLSKKRRSPMVRHCIIICRQEQPTDHAKMADQESVPCTGAIDDPTTSTGSFHSLP